MSRGLGFLQRRLLLCLERRGYAASIGSLCTRIYDLAGWQRPDINQRHSVIRACRLLIAAGFPLALMESKGHGSELIVTGAIQRKAGN
jgi:hypothetical protein